MKALLCAFVGLALVANALGQITNLFQIDFTTSLNGGCAYVGLANMNSIAVDAHALGVIGSQIVTDYRAGVAEAVRLLNSFFKPDTPALSGAQLTAINNKYTAVTNWLASGGTYNRNGPVKAPPPNPFLFCYHNFLEKKAMTDAVFDINGNTFPGNPNDIGSPVQINQVASLVAAQQTETQNSGVNAVPYWFDRIKGYLFDRSYGASPRGYCSAAANDAATQHQTPISTLTLCPLSFGGVNQGFNAANPPAIKIKGRRPCDPVVATTRAKLPAENTLDTSLQNLRQCLPTATTLFHELFHLVLGTNVGVSYPAAGEVYNLFQGTTHMVGLDYATALTNPESFVNAAVAYDYTLNADPDEDGNRVEFYSGYATQG